MKIKHVLASLGLAMTTAFAVVVGVAPSKEAKSVKADAENTWMVRFQLNLEECSPSNPESVFPADDKVYKVEFHCWGTDLDDKYEASHLFVSFDRDFYGVNVALGDLQTINGAQWILHQEQSGEKYSVNVEGFGSNEVTYLNKTNSESIFAVEYQYQHNWTGDGKWTFDNPVGSAASSIKVDVGVDEHHYFDFVKEPAKNVFAARNAVIEKEDGMSFDTPGVDITNGAFNMLDEDSLDYITSSGQSNWWWIDSGTYDFVLSSANYSIRKYVDPSVTYIYYVLEDNVPTNDYIYTWGGSEQFGNWPGKQIRTEIASASEVTGNGVLHFEGSETPKLIYKIPVTIGYPNGDSYFKLNNNNDWESEARPLVSGAAYWYAGDANEDAGLAIEFLVQAEYCRNTATDYSVCNISVNEAKVLVNSYNGLSAGVRDYIDRSSVYTYARSGEGNALVSYRDVMVQIALIAEISLVGSSMSFYNFSYDYNNTSVVAIIIVIAAVSMAALGTLLILKKKRK